MNIYLQNDLKHEVKKQNDWQVVSFILQHTSFSPTLINLTILPRYITLNVSLQQISTKVYIT